MEERRMDTCLQKRRSSFQGELQTHCCAILYERNVEELISRQVIALFDDHLGDYLCAYRKHHSCETTPVGLVQDCKTVKDNRLSVGILSTDMSIGFGCLHPPLLKACGFQDNAIKILSSYLRDRHNRVGIGSQTSPWRQVNRGCPQGSVLGPLLLNIF